MSDDTRICEINATGTIVSDNNHKYCTNEIKIVKEIKSKRKKHCNIDNSDTGYCNSGYCNSGNRNSGDWNSGNCNSGIFNTEKNPTINIFDKDSEWTIEDWLSSIIRTILIDMPHTHSNFIYESEMTCEDKEKHPEYKTIGGYVKTTIVTNEDRQKFWDSLSNSEKEECYKLPNFDSEKFIKCLGIEHL